MEYAIKSHRLVTTIAFLIALTVSLGIGIVPLEKSGDPNSKFITTEDGIWWAVTTVTGVGYGDYVPRTTPGRIIGVILETMGVTLFGLTIALITVSLLRREQQFYWSRTTSRFDSLEEKVDKLTKQQAFTIKENGSTRK